MFSLPHVAIAGHGTGAYSAAEIYKTGLFAIDGLFGIGLDGVNQKLKIRINCLDLHQHFS